MQSNRVINILGIFFKNSAILEIANIVTPRHKEWLDYSPFGTNSIIYYKSVLNKSAHPSIILDNIRNPEYKFS